MKFFWEGLKGAFHLLTHPDDALLNVLVVTFQVAFWSTLAALAIGLPLGLMLGLGHFRGRQSALTLANAGLELPPVVIGLILASPSRARHAAAWVRYPRRVATVPSGWLTATRQRTPCWVA